MFKKIQRASEATTNNPEHSLDYMDTLIAEYDKGLNRYGNYTAFYATAQVLSQKLYYLISCTSFLIHLLSVVHSYTISSLQNQQKNKTMCIQDEGGHFEQLLQNTLHKVQTYSLK
jgi:hypothetical protein